MLIEEQPSDVRTITGVATSVTAFLGSAARGPTDTATTITSWAHYERVFGGLSIGSPMSDAVRHFYDNGGSVAVIVRLYKAEDERRRFATLARSDVDLQLRAASPGDWGDGLRVRIDQRPATRVNGTDDRWLAKVAGRLGVDAADLYDLTVRDTASGVTERFLNVTTRDSARRVDLVLDRRSRLVRAVDGAPLPATLTVHAGTLADDDVWTDDAASTAATPAGPAATLDDAAYIGSPTHRTGLHALDDADVVNLLCIAASSRGTAVPRAVYDAALTYCEARRAMLIVDPDPAWTADGVAEGVAALGLTGERARNAAVYVPRVTAADPLLGGQLDSFAPSGMVAGVIARTDATRGVWKAPAGTDATLEGAAGLAVSLTDVQRGALNRLGINCLRSLPVVGRVVWGARTMRGADADADEFKYVPVRRTALFIEESVRRGLQWVALEPNGEPLWSQIRLHVGAFLHGLFRQGAFQGATPREAYFVKCDRDTTTQRDVDLGIVNVLVGFAPMKPAEFVVIRLQQRAGRIPP